LLFEKTLRVRRLNKTFLQPSNGRLKRFLGNKKVLRRFFKSDRLLSSVERCS
jgi:hypothetical protein